MIVYVTRPASGLTRFLEECQASWDDDSLLFYIDGSNQLQNNIFSKVLLTLKQDHQEMLEEWSAYLSEEEGWPRESKLLASLARAIPHFGDFIGEILEYKIDEETVSLSDHPEAVAQLFADFLARLSNERDIVFFVDDAQAVDAHSMSLLQKTGTRRYSNINYVLGYVERDGFRVDRRDLRARLVAQGYDVLILDFPRPGPDFVRDLAQEHEVNVGRKEARRIVNREQGHIHSLIESVLHNQNDSPRESTHADRRPLERQVLLYLVVAGQSLRISDIVALTSRSSSIFLRSSSELYASLDSLEAQGFVATQRIPGEDRLVELSSVSSPRVSAIRDDLAGVLTASEEVYRYFQELHAGQSVHSAAEIIPLLYRLSKRLDPGASFRYEDEIIRTSLRFGAAEAAIEFIGSTFPLSDLEDPQSYMLRVALLIAVREYERALSLLEQRDLRTVQPTYAVSAFKAICLNRERRHDESEEIIDRLLASSLPPLELKVLLASYKVSGRFHENDLEGARRVFNEIRDELESARNLGYLIRNAAAAFPAPRNIELALEAEQLLSNIGDEFGAMSAVANRGGYRCEEGDYESALGELRTARAALERFGVNHLHIVENNLGLCYMHLGHLSEAEEHLSRAVVYARSTLPQVYSRMNVATLRALQSEIAEAMEIVKSLEDIAERGYVEAIRQLYYPGAAVLGAYAGEDSNLIERWISKANLHPDPLVPGWTLGVTDTVRTALSTQEGITQDQMLELMPTYRMEYWYQHPTALLSKDLLASDTIG